jgi:hypothetical protein
MPSPIIAARIRQNARDHFVDAQIPGDGAG